MSREGTIARQNIISEVAALLCPLAVATPSLVKCFRGHLADPNNPYTFQFGGYVDIYPENELMFQMSYPWLRNKATLELSLRRAATLKRALEPDPYTEGEGENEYTIYDRFIYIIVCI